MHGLSNPFLAAGMKADTAADCMTASIPELHTREVYNSALAVVDPRVPVYWMSLVKEADAKAAYGPLIDFTKAMKANPITASSPPSEVSSSSAIMPRCITCGARALGYCDGCRDGPFCGFCAPACGRCPARLCIARRCIRTHQCRPAFRNLVGALGGAGLTELLDRDLGKDM